MTRLRIVNFDNLIKTSQTLFCINPHCFNVSSLICRVYEVYEMIHISSCHLYCEPINEINIDGIE